MLGERLFHRSLRRGKKLKEQSLLPDEMLGVSVPSSAAWADLAQPLELAGSRGVRLCAQAIMQSVSMWSWWVFLTVSRCAHACSWAGSLV